MERKCEWFCDVKFLRSNFKAELEKGVCTKIHFLASGFCSHAANSLRFFVCFQFFDWILF